MTYASCHSLKSVLASICLVVAITSCYKARINSPTNDIQVYTITDTASISTVHLYTITDVVSVKDKAVYKKLNATSKATDAPVQFTPFDVVFNISLLAANGKFIGVSSPGTVTARPANQTYIDGKMRYTSSVALSGLSYNFSPRFPASPIQVNWSCMVTDITTTTNTETNETSTATDHYSTSGSQIYFAPPPY